MFYIEKSEELFLTLRPNLQNILFPGYSARSSSTALHDSVIPMQLMMNSSPVSSSTSVWNELGDSTGNTGRTSFADFLGGASGNMPNRVGYGVRTKPVDHRSSFKVVLSEPYHRGEKIDSTDKAFNYSDSYNDISAVIGNKFDYKNNFKKYISPSKGRFANAKPSGMKYWEDDTNDILYIRPNDKSKYKSKDTLYDAEETDFHAKFTVRTYKEEGVLKKKVDDGTLSVEADMHKDGELSAENRTIKFKHGETDEEISGQIIAPLTKRHSVVIGGKTFILKDNTAREAFLKAARDVCKVEQGDAKMVAKSLTPKFLGGKPKK